MCNAREQGEDSLHKSLRTAHWAHRKRMWEEFIQIGLTEGQPKILGLLKWNDGCIQREIAVNCHIKASTVTSILLNMEKAGLIYRATNPRDRRILNVYLTEKGKKSNEEIEAKFRTVDEECFEGFTEEEKAQTILFLNRINDNLKKRKEMHD